MGEDRIVLVAEEKDIMQAIGSNFFGFLESNNTSHLRAIEEKSFWMPEKEAMKNKNIREIIGYTVIANRFSRYIFVYQRAVKKKHYKESRLSGKWSCGIGGHIEKKNFPEVTGSIFNGTLLEISQETDCDFSSHDLSLLGFINDATKQVDQDHFGILFLACTNKEELKISKEASQAGFIPLLELNLMIAKSEKADEPDVETWTKISAIELSKLKRK